MRQKQLFFKFLGEKLAEFLKFWVLTGLAKMECPELYHASTCGSHHDVLRRFMSIYTDFCLFMRGGMSNRQNHCHFAKA